MLELFRWMRLYLPLIQIRFRSPIWIPPLIDFWNLVLFLGG